MTYLLVLPIVVATMLLPQKTYDLPVAIKEEPAGEISDEDSLATPLETGACEKSTPKEYAKCLYGDKFDYIDNIIQRESGWNPLAQNPTHTAYGLHQFIDGTWKTVGCTKSSDPYIQLDCGKKYIEQRYETPEKAWKFWQQHHWY